jgi:hypothetical protein
MAGKRPNKAAAHGKGNQEASYFLSLSLENMRCFGPKQTLDLSDGKGRPAQWTILLGENGTGKTTVLQALAAFTPITNPELAAHLKHAPLGVLWDLSYHGYEFQREACASDTHLTVTGIERAALHGAAQQGHHFSFPLTVKPGGQSMQYPTRDPFVAWPVSYGYGAGRRLGATSTSQPGNDDPIVSLFSDNVTLRNAEEWLLLLDYATSKSSDHRQKQRLQQIKDLLIEILPGVKDIRFNPSAGVFPKPCVEFHTPYGWVRLRSLAYGHETLIAWMVDFASRMVERYPNSADPLAEPAVVLVDEIDLHLHPRWQRKLIGYLTEHFPNTQFIVTAHSPLVVQAAAGANIALLRREGDHVVIDNDLKAVRGWRIDQIYTSDLFGLESARPPELDEPLARRRAILSKSTLTAADRRELAALEKQIGDLPVGESREEIRDLALIRQTLDELKQARMASQ